MEPLLPCVESRPHFLKKNDEKLEIGIREDLMLHAYMLTQSGIPMLYSSDEVGRLNDYSYKDDPDKAAGFPLYPPWCFPVGSREKTEIKNFC